MLIAPPHFTLWHQFYSVHINPAGRHTHTPNRHCVFRPWCPLCPSLFGGFNRNWSPEDRTAGPPHGAQQSRRCRATPWAEGWAMCKKIGSSGNFGGFVKEQTFILKLCMCESAVWSHLLFRLRFIPFIMWMIGWEKDSIKLFYCISDWFCCSPLMSRRSRVAADPAPVRRRVSNPPSVLLTFYQKLYLKYPGVC